MATILALSGDELTLSSLQDILETFGHTVVAAQADAEALAALAAGPVDLVLIDVLESVHNLGDLVGAARNHRSQPRVIGVTAYPKAARALEALEAGAHGLMQKPFEIGRILELLEGRPS